MKNIYLKTFLSSTAIALSFNAFALDSNSKASLEKAFKTEDNFVIDAVKQRIISQGRANSSSIENYIDSLEYKKRQAEIAKANADNKKFSGKIEGGASFETGNTERENVNINGELSYKHNRWENILSGQAYSSEEDGNRAAEEYRVTNKTKYNFTEFDYGFLELSYVDDRFSGFDYRVDELLGYGRRLINEDDMKLNTEVSIGARQSKLTTGDKEESGLAKLRGDFEWDINKYLSFEQDLAVTYDTEEIMIVNSDTGLKAQMTDALYLRLGFQFENISEVPAGVESTDTRTTVNVGYNF